MDSAHSPSLSALEPVILQISRFFYSREAHVDWIPSDEADVFRLRFDDLEPRILKVERSERWVVRREQLAFPHLRAAGFTEFPLIEFTQADWSEDGRAFMLMPETRWRPLNELWDEDQQNVGHVVRRIGTFLSSLSAVDWRTIPGVVTPTLKRDSYLGWYSEWFRPLRELPSMRGPVDAALTQALALVAEEPRGFGGWQGAQVLTDGAASFTVVDWPNIGAHWPLEDVAGAIVSFTDIAPRAADVLGPVLLDAWTGGRGLNRKEQAELQLWLVLWYLHDATVRYRKGAVREAEQAVDRVREFTERGIQWA